MSPPIVAPCWLPASPPSPVTGNTNYIGIALINVFNLFENDKTFIRRKPKTVLTGQGRNAPSAEQGPESAEGDTALLPTLPPSPPLPHLGVTLDFQGTDSNTRDAQSNQCKVTLPHGLVTAWCHIHMSAIW
ncbi:Interleukin-1 Receptor Accessory Protein-Like 1 [Manis pentadactyla]|nr:Interleukin-1 Receptor Accessory Protein-Like 1 [Manis pentadactyla]